jgi:hypothetical protein
MQLAHFSAYVMSFFFFFFFVVRGPRSWCYGRTAALRLIVQPLWWRWGWAVFYQVLQLMEHQWNEIDRRKPTTRRKTCPSATLSTTNPTWTDPGSNSGLRGERPATNRLSHGTACSMGVGWFVYWTVVCAEVWVPTRKVLLLPLIRG